MSCAKRRKTEVEGNMSEATTGSASGLDELDCNLARQKVEKALHGSTAVDPAALVRACVQAELAYAQANEEFPFYSVYMLSLACVSKWHDARMLLLRIETISNPSFDLSVAVEVVKLSLWSRVGDAATLIERSSWGLETKELASMLSKKLRAETQNLIAKSFVCVDKTRCAALLGLSVEEACELVTRDSAGHPGWKVDRDFLIPDRSGESAPFDQLSTDESRARASKGRLENLTQNLISLQFT